MDTGAKLIVTVFIGISILLPRQVDAAKPTLDDSPKFLDLAEAKFAPLTEAERKMFEAIPNGEIADCSASDNKDNDPTNAANWPKARTIRAECIEWLCTDSEASKRVTHKGFCVKGARIDGELDLKFAKISFPLLFVKCAFPQTIYLLNAKIPALDLTGTHTGPIYAYGLNVDGDVSLSNDFKAEGEVNLTGAIINGSLGCEKGKFINPNGNALTAYRLKVNGAVFLRNGFRADGKVILIGATIGRFFIWTGVDSPENVTLDLQSAKIGTLCDRKKSWPVKGNLFLHGLEYDEISDDAPKDAKRRIDWLRRQGDEQFRPQPYQQLADVLRKSGRDADAKKILIAKNKDRSKWGPKLTWSEWFWYRVFGPMIGYGHSPWRAFLIGLTIILFGSLVFRLGSKNNLMAATKDAENASSAKFHALVYSIDMFVPLVDLYQAKYWLPDTNQKAELRPFNLSWFKVPVSGNGLRRYLWFHISIGWILTTLLVVGLTGLVRT